MAHYQHHKDRKYRLFVKDESAAGRKRLSTIVEVPEEIAKSDRKSKQWLDLELAKFAEEVKKGKRVQYEKITLREFAPRWKSMYAAQNMGGNTIHSTMQFIDGRILPTFGDIRIDQIRTIQLVAFVSELKRKDGKTMATNTKLNIFKALKSMFDAAFKWNLIPDNPMEGVQRPTIGKKEKKELRSKKKSYTRDEVSVLFTALYNLPIYWRLYFTGVILGGFRRGEMLAIEWDDVNHQKNAIYIETQITLDEDGKKIEREVKTEESEGWVAMPKWYMDELKRYQKVWNREKLECPKWKAGDKKYVFHGKYGIMFHPSTPTGTWRKFLADHNLPHVKLHGLRHTAGMLLREDGKDLKTIQERLRHTRIDITANLYTHESESITRDAADSLEDLNPQNGTRSGTHRAK